MSHPENWELQLAPLINTADLLSVFEPDNGVLAGITMKSAHSSPQPRSSRTSNESATALLPDAVYRNGATNKATKDRVEIISYPMNGAGAKKCLREAVMLKRPSLCAEHQTSATRRGLQHIISPLGIWTTAETSLLHVRRARRRPVLKGASLFCRSEANLGLPSRVWFFVCCFSCSTLFLTLWRLRPLPSLFFVQLVMNNPGILTLAKYLGTKFRGGVNPFSLSLEITFLGNSGTNVPFLPAVVNHTMLRW